MKSQKLIKCEFDEKVDFSSVNSICLVNQGESIVSCHDRSLRVWKMNPFTLTQTSVFEDDFPKSNMILLNDPILAIIDKQSIALYNYKTNKRQSLSVGQPSHKYASLIDSIIIKLDDTLLAQVFDLNQIRIWNYSKEIPSEMVKSRITEKNSIYSLVLISLDKIAIGLMNQRINIRDINTKEITKTLQLNQEFVQIGTILNLSTNEIVAAMKQQDQENVYKIILWDYCKNKYSLLGECKTSYAPQLTKINNSKFALIDDDVIFTVGKKLK
jgi:hypothetical protein